MTVKLFSRILKNRHPGSFIVLLINQKNSVVIFVEGD